MDIDIEKLSYVYQTKKVLEDIKNNKTKYYKPKSL